MFYSIMAAVHAWVQQLNFSRMLPVCACVCGSGASWHSQGEVKGLGSALGLQR